MTLQVFYFTCAKGPSKLYFNKIIQFLTGDAGCNGCKEVVVQRHSCMGIRNGHLEHLTVYNNYYIHFTAFFQEQPG